MTRIFRTLPPAAAPINLGDIVSGIRGLLRAETTSYRFEEELKEHYNIMHCYTLSSGKAALTLILQALKEMFPDRDEVLIPAFTCYSVPSAVVRAGLKIRLCDLDPETFDYDYERLSDILSTGRDRLLCVVPVHLFGIPADIDRLRSTIDDDAVIIVEDAAQAMGGENKGRKFGTQGDVGFFSLGRGKALSTVEGGIILTKRQDIAAYIGRAMKGIPCYGALEIFGLFIYALALMILMRPTLFWIPKSIPFLRLGETIYDPHFKMRKMSSFQAGLARGWEKKLQQLSNRRMENVRDFQDRLKMISPKSSWADQRFFPCLIRFPLRIESVHTREAILKMSERMGFGIARSYPDSIDRIPALAADFASRHFPVAKDNAEILLTLPVHSFVALKDREQIADLLAKAKHI